MGTRFMNHIVCYTGGTCGDLITAMIDSAHAEVKNQVIVHAEFRQRLKKPHTFVDDQEKTQYINEIFQTYQSIPSHDLAYHVGHKHKFITITVQDFSTAQWAAKRFKQLHRAHVWEEMSRVSGATTVNDYAQLLIDYSSMIKQHTDLAVKLERIVDGTVADDLAQLVDLPIDVNLYKRWLQSQ